jgi:hypothetical protein
VPKAKRTKGFVVKKINLKANREYVICGLSRRKVMNELLDAKNNINNWTIPQSNFVFRLVLSIKRSLTLDTGQITTNHLSSLIIISIIIMCVYSNSINQVEVPRLSINTHLNSTKSVQCFVEHCYVEGSFHLPKPNTQIYSKNWFFQCSLSSRHTFS